MTNKLDHNLKLIEMHLQKYKNEVKVTIKNISKW